MKTPKIMYVEAKKNHHEPINTKELDKLPKQIYVVYSIQYKALAEEIRAYLSTKGSRIHGFKQVLGCSKLKTKHPILLVGSGKFHAINLMVQNNSQIYIYNLRIEKISKQDIQKIKLRIQASLTKFLTSDKIGILVSTKPGQNRIKDARSLKKKLESKGKKAYLFTANNLNLQELENFPIDFWVNTACPGLAYDSTKIINIDDLSTVNY